MNIDEIATQLHRIILKAQSDAIESQGGAWREKYEWLISEIDSLYGQAKAFHDDMVEKGLTTSSIESEGYLRACLSMRETVKMIEDNYEKDIE